MTWRSRHINTGNVARSFKTLLGAALISLFMLPGELTATHIVGGDLRYKCLGNNLYEIRMTLRRDCFLGDPLAQFDDPASIGFFNARTNQRLPFAGSNGQLLMELRPDDTLNQEFISDCTISGNDVCVQQTIYVDTVELPFLEDGYRLAYQRCCRNNTLQNIIEPLGAGMTLVTIISGRAQQECNSSPILPDYPPIYICVDDPILFDFSIQADPDGDSVIYELFSPFVGASQLFPRPQPPPNPPYDTVVWSNPPYSLDNLIGGVPLEIDRFTGRLTGQPNTIGQFLVGVRIFSYDSDGVLIEVTSREWQYNVRACREVPEAEFEVNADLNCDNLTLSFNNLSDAQLDILWIFDYPNPDSDISTDPNVEYTFPAGGFYDVALIVTDPDSICFDTMIGTVGVFESELEASFDLVVIECTDSIVAEIIDLSVEPDTGFIVDTWHWSLVIGNDTIRDTTQNPTFVLDSSVQDITVNLVVTSDNGCTAETSASYDLNIIEIPFKGGIGDTIGVCDGDTVLLFKQPGNPNFNYIWADIPGLDVSVPNNPRAFPDVNTEYLVTVTDGFCSVEGNVLVAVEELPILDFTVNTDCRTLDIDIMNMSTGFQFEWDFGDGSGPNFEESPSHTYAQPGTYTVTLFSADGCDVVTQDAITVVQITDTVEATAIGCFAGPVQLNPFSDEDAYDYLWSNGDLLSDSTAGSPIAMVDSTMMFFVTITDPALPDCGAVDSVLVIVPQDFELEAPTDTSYCDSPEITLIAGNSDLSYQWFDLAGDLLGDEAELTVQPIDTTFYVLVGIDSFGCTKSDTVTLSPTFFDISVSDDLTICAGDDTVIAVINQDPNQILLYSWSPAEFIIGPNDVPNPRVMPNQDQVYTVQIMNMTLGCMVERQVEVRVSQFDYTISPETVTCAGESASIGVVNNDTTQLGYQWSPVESIVDGEDTANPTVLPEETTLYTVQILNQDYGCLTTDSVLVVVSRIEPEDVIVTSNPDSIFANSGEVFVIGTNQDPDLDFSWTGTGIVNPTFPVIEASPNEEGLYSYAVTVTNADGCTASGQISNLLVIDPACDMTDVFIPNAFSPNGDGENDVLEVYGNFITGMELRIYNRWGEEVFVSRSQTEAWDGTFDGELLGPDVYGYYLMVECPPDKQYFKKGNVVLLR